MYVKITPRKKKDKTYYCAELVEGTKENGKVKHRRIMYFGSVDSEMAEKLKIVFSKDFDDFTNLNKINYSSAVSYGSFVLLDTLFSESGLFAKMQKTLLSQDPHITTQTTAECIKAMVFQRLLKPDSKLAFLEWAPTTPLSYFTSLREEWDLQTLYRSLEVLEENWEPLEKELYQIALNIYQQTHKELFYDITSSYLEGHHCTIATYGYSRDKRKDKVQIVIGLVTTYDGFPIQCKIYPGNTKDETTVSAVIEELTQQYPIQEIVFVGDRGMLTANNVKAIQDKQQKYVMAIPRQWSKKYLHNTIISEDHMEEMETHLYATTIDNESSTSDERLVLCLNTQKREDDQAYRNKCMDTIQKELDTLKERVHNSSIQASSKKNRTHLSRDEVMKKAGSILKDTPAGKYFHVYTVEVDNKNKPSSTNHSITHATSSSSSSKESCRGSFQESFRFQYDIVEEKVKEDQRLDGTFLIQTNQRSDTKKRLIEIYKHLNTVENAFRILKNDLDIRPMYHWKENRVKGHIYMCVLAYFLMMAIEYTSKRASIHLSGRKILRLLSNIHLLTLTLPKGEKRFALTGVGKEEKKVLKAFGIPKIKVPMVV